tara:strand:+ start:114 stop:728 length:615 start_codon:yes stop_codon:yes gene_type:complete
MDKTIPQYFIDEGIEDKEIINKKCHEDMELTKREGHRFFKNELPTIVQCKYIDWILFRITYEPHGLVFPPWMESTKSLIENLRNYIPANKGNLELCNLLEIFNDYSNYDSYGRGIKLDTVSALQKLAGIDLNILDERGKAEYHLFNEQLKYQSLGQKIVEVQSRISKSNLELAIGYFERYESRSDVNAGKLSRCKYLIKQYQNL